MILSYKMFCEFMKNEKNNSNQMRRNENHDKVEEAKWNKDSK